MKPFDLAFSPCPNDTFIFHAMTHGLTDTKGIGFVSHLHDVEELNKKAIYGAFHISKLSFYAYLKLKKTYDILNSGAAIGYGCGPLLVGRSFESLRADSRIAIPGKYTTAALLLNLWNPELKNIEVTRFDYILNGVKAGKYDFGLIIHEGRFVYADYGLVKIVDLGQWWESETGLPIPLGCIALKKDPPVIKRKKDIDIIIHGSVKYALKHKHISRTFIKSHAQEIDDRVIDEHIKLYVNDFTLSLGETGKKAIQTLEEMAKWRMIL